ncbi:MAG TPA: OmpA family protein, partial [Xanthobacteraceae bacterium]|nr:OmpA family protein [Xanthobacteraceae bacterium]
MKPHQIYLALCLTLMAALGAAVADTRLTSSQITNSLLGVSNTRLAITAAELRQRAVANVQNFPGAVPPPGHLLVIPEFDKLAQFTVEINFDFNSAAIKPESYRDVGAIADALHNPILLGYGILVIGHTDAVGTRTYNLGLSQRRAEAIRNALIDPFGVNPAVLEAVGLGEEQLQDPKHPKAAVNRRVELVNIG